MKKIILTMLMVVYFIGYSQDINNIPKLKEVVLDSSYNHNKWETIPVDVKYEFAAYTTSFDTDDPTIEGGENISLGIPEWVSFEIHGGVSSSKCRRPRPWLTDTSLFNNGVAPGDNSYHVSGTKALTVVSGDYRFVRGHMCPFATASRIGCDASWNTCLMMNAVPQLQWQNNLIWKGLEKNCTDWADKHNKVWVICGPVFFNKNPSLWLGQQNEKRVAVPDALFKIVIRESSSKTGIETIAFIIPNIIPKNKRLDEYVTNIAQIENLTGLKFLNTLSPTFQKIEKSKHGIPELPFGYNDLTSSERKRVREKRKKTFYEVNKILIQSWFE